MTSDSSPEAQRLMAGMKGISDFISGAQRFRQEQEKAQDKLVELQSLMKRHSHGVSPTERLNRRAKNKAARRARKGRR